MANITYYIYSKSDGHGIGIESRPKDDCLINLEPNQAKTLVNFDFFTQLFLNGMVIDKPASKITLTGTKLENLPNPTTVTITGNSATFVRTITDRAYEFTVDVPGEYMIKCESRVELPIEFKINIL